MRHIEPPARLSGASLSASRSTGPLQGFLPRNLPCPRLSPQITLDLRRSTGTVPTEDGENEAPDVRLFAARCRRWPALDYRSGSGRAARQFNFAVDVKAPDSVQLQEHDAYTWTELKDEPPVTDAVQQVLATYRAV